MSERGVFGDQGRPARRSEPTRSGAPDGKSILELFATGRPNEPRLAFDVATGVLTEITKGNQAVLRFRAAADNSKLVYLSRRLRASATYSGRFRRGSAATHAWQRRVVHN